MKQSPSCEADTWSAGQVISLILWIWRFITMFARGYNWTLSWASWIQSI